MRSIKIFFNFRPSSSALRPVHVHLSKFLYIFHPEWRWSLIIHIIRTMIECQPKSFNQSKCFQVPSKFCTGHHIEWWYHRWSNKETKDCHKMIHFPVASWSCNQSNDHQVKDEFHKPLPKCDCYDNSIISEWKLID